MKRMYRKLVSFMALAVAALATVGCHTDTSVSGAMGYARSYAIVEQMERFDADSPCDIITAQIEERVLELNEAYAKTWEVTYSGASIDTALDLADQEAFTGFEAAYYNLYKLGEEFAARIAKSYLGQGAFRYEYAVVVRRNVPIYTSYGVKFEYDSTKTLGQVAYARQGDVRGIGEVVIPDDVTDGKVVRTATVDAPYDDIVEPQVAIYGPDLALWQGEQFAEATLENGVLTMTLNLSDELVKSLAEGVWYYTIKGRTAADGKRACVEVPFTLTFKNE